MGSVYSRENYRNRCHLMSDFKAKEASTSMSAAAPPQIPLGELTALPQTLSWLPSPLSALRASKQFASPNMYPQIRLCAAAHYIVRKFRSQMFILLFSLQTSTRLVSWGWTSSCKRIRASSCTPSCSERCRSWRSTIDSTTFTPASYVPRFAFLFKIKLVSFRVLFWFLPRCMECRRGLAMRIPSVRPSDAWIVTKRQKDMFIFLYDTKDNLS